MFGMFHLVISWLVYVASASAPATCLNGFTLSPAGMATPALQAALQSFTQVSTVSPQVFSNAQGSHFMVWCQGRFWLQVGTSNAGCHTQTATQTTFVPDGQACSSFPGVPASGTVSNGVQTVRVTVSVPLTAGGATPGGSVGPGIPTTQPSSPTTQFEVATLETSSEEKDKKKKKFHQLLVYGGIGFGVFNALLLAIICIPCKRKDPAPPPPVSCPRSPQITPPPPPLPASRGSRPRPRNQRNTLGN